MNCDHPLQSTLFFGRDIGNVSFGLTIETNRISPSLVSLSRTCCCITHRCSLSLLHRLLSILVSSLLSPLPFQLCATTSSPSLAALPGFVSAFPLFTRDCAKTIFGQPIPNPTRSAARHKGSTAHRQLVKPQCTALLYSESLG